MQDKKFAAVWSNAAKAEGAFCIWSALMTGTTSGATELAPIFVAPPFFPAWQKSLPANPQSQARALRVPSEALTPGPKVRRYLGSAAGRAGGFSFLQHTITVARRIIHCQELVVRQALQDESSPGSNQNWFVDSRCVFPRYPHC